MLLKVSSEYDISIHIYTLYLNQCKPQILQKTLTSIYNHY